MALESRLFWEEFIELYRIFPCLWNVKCKDYGNKQLKNNAYEALVQKCKEIYEEANKDFVTKRINNFRTAFRREFKKVKDSKRPGSRSDETYEPTLWYYYLLLFTAENETPRKGRTNVKDEDNDEEEEIENMNDESEITSQTAQASPGNLHSSSYYATPDTCEKSMRGGRKYSSEKKKKREWLNPPHPMANLYKEEDEYDVVGRRIAFHLKGMDEYQTLLAEKLVSDIMFYGRLGKLTEQSTVSVAPTIPDGSCGSITMDPDGSICLAPTASQL